MRRERLVNGAWMLVALIAVAGFSANASAQNAKADKAQRKEAKRVPLEYKHDPQARSRAQAQDVAPSTVPDVPAEIKVPARTPAPQVEAQRRAVATRPAADPEAQGDMAGERMATEAAREWGWRQYWRAGFQRGMRDGLADTRNAAWDRQDGARDGRRDPRAIALGSEIAQDSAQDAAFGVAADAVREEFSDLSRQPRRNATSGRRTDPGRWIGAGPWALAPVFDEVFASFPVTAAPGLNREARSALDGWNAQAATLARDDRWQNSYDPLWKDSGYAFSVWRDRQRPGSNWSRFGPGERDRFRASFFASFDLTMGSMDLRSTYAGYRVGYADGFRYGVAVNAEWNYRQGFAEGFDEGVRASAVIAFPFLYERAFTSAYDAEFRRWSQSAVPSFAGLQLLDGSDDGVIEPGERVALTGQLVNLGGAPGTFELRADSSVLDQPGGTSVRMPARSRTTLDPIELRVADRVAPRTRSEIVVSVGDDQARVPLTVSRPLEIDGDVDVDADALAGRVRVIVTVANRSRVPLRAEAAISSLNERTSNGRTERLSIPAGGSVRTEASYDGLRPLDILGGTLQWQASVRRGATEDDARTIELAPTATNLDDPDLITYMIDLAHSRQASRRDVSEARALLMDRLRVDWQRAAAADGNPYKLDYERGSATTALGELVRALGSSRGSFANRSVFSGAGSDISALAEDLPGAHPLLRKWMKKLAKRVG